MDGEEKTTKRKRKSGWDKAADDVQPSNSSTLVSAPLAINPLLQNSMQEIEERRKAQKSLEDTLSMALTNPDIKSLLPHLLQPPAVQPQGDTRIYVGSLHYDLPPAQVKALFSSFGTIQSMEMSMEAGNLRSKGFCFITYESALSAEGALAMNGFEIAGRKIKVGRPYSPGPGAKPGQPMMSLPLGGLPNLGYSSPAMSLLPGMLGTPAAITAAAGYNNTAKEQAQALLYQALGLIPAAVAPTTVSTPYTLPTTPSVPSSIPGAANSSSTAFSATTSQTNGPAPAINSHSLLIRNIAPDITITKLKLLFSSFGTITYGDWLDEDEEVKHLNRLHTCTSIALKGVAIIVYREEEVAEEAQNGMNDLELSGKNLKVNLIPDTKQIPSSLLLEINPASKSSPESIGGTTVPLALPASQSGYIPGTLLKLHDMVSVEEASDPDFRDEIAEEVSSFGPIKDINVLTRPNGVLIEVYFVQPADAAKALKALNGRYFAGKVVLATLS